MGQSSITYTSVTYLKSIYINFVGGLCLETNEPLLPNVPKWVYIFATIGDCKVFKYDCQKQECADITIGNRNNIDDPRDPGGRLGMLES